MSSIKVKINNVDTTVEASNYMNILELHIEELLQLTKQELKNKLALRNYIEVNIMDKEDNYWGGCIWVPPGVVTLTTTDGHERQIPFDIFVQIIEVTPGIEGLELVPIHPLSPNNTDLIENVNNPSGIGWSIIASPTCTEDTFDWRFNAGNGIMAFKKCYEEHKRVILYHNRYIGYHFDPANRSTILRYYKPKSKGVM